MRDMGYQWFCVFDVFHKAGRWPSSSFVRAFSRVNRTACYPYLLFWGKYNKRPICHHNITFHDLTVRYIQSKAYKVKASCYPLFPRIHCLYHHACSILFIMVSPITCHSAVTLNPYMAEITARNKVISQVIGVVIRHVFTPREVRGYCQFLMMRT